MLKRSVKKKIHPRIASSLADAFSPQEMIALSELGTIVEFSEGRTLFTQGKPSLETMLIVEGKIDIQRDDQSVAQSSAGDFVGEIGVLNKSPRSANAVAASDVAVLVMSAREFDSLLFLQPSLRESITATADTRIAEVLDLRSTRQPAVGSAALVGAA